MADLSNPKNSFQMIEKKKGDQIFLDDPDTLRDFTPVAFVKRSFILTSQNKMRIFDVGTTKQLSTIEFVTNYTDTGIFHVKTDNSQFL